MPVDRKVCPRCPATDCIIPEGNDLGIMCQKCHCYSRYALRRCKDCRLAICQFCIRIDREQCHRKCPAQPSQAGDLASHRVHKRSVAFAQQVYRGQLETIARRRTSNARQPHQPTAVDKYFSHVHRPQVWITTGARVTQGTFAFAQGAIFYLLMQGCLVFPMHRYRHTLPMSFSSHHRDTGFLLLTPIGTFLRWIFYMFLGSVYYCQVLECSPLLSELGALMWLEVC